MTLLRDTWLLFLSNMRATLRSPANLILGLFQPICWLLLFAPLLAYVAQMPGFPEGGPLNVFTPGVLVMMGMYGSAFAGFGLIADLRAGVIEQLRVSPVNRLAPLLGRALRDMVVLLLQSLIMLGLAWILGMRASLGGVILALGLVLLFGLMMSSASYALALTVKDEYAFAPVTNFLTLPLLLISGITLPLTFAPDWLRGLANISPLTHAVDASRSLFDGQIASGAVLRGFVVTIMLLLLALWWAGRSFRKATA